MIYLIDTPVSDNSHSKYVLDIIKKHSTVEVKLIELPENPTFGQINSLIINLFYIVLPSDIVLCPWAVSGNDSVDEVFNDLAKLCWVVVAAGNFNKPIEEYSPARANDVITVACLNKSGLKAALSNFSKNKSLIWVPGTNYNVGWKNSSGTSVSAAIYAAFLAESIKEKNLDILDDLLENYKNSVFQEIQK